MPDLSHPLALLSELLIAETSPGVSSANDAALPALERLSEARASVLGVLTPVGGLPKLAEQTPAHSLSQHLLRFLQTKNQFLAPSAATQTALEALFGTTLAELQPLLSPHSQPDLSALQTWLASHRTRLRGFVEQHFDRQLREVTCSEYSAELQLQVLGIDLQTLLEPILDVGAGANGQLVRYLRAQGKNVQGLDRAAQSLEILRADWLKYAFPPKTWGTVISHLGFSLHFLHQHLKSEDSLALDYARKYMEILHGLRPGGSFIYAPGLPFIEALLPNTAFRISKHEVPEELAQLADPALARSTGLRVIYATQIQRL